MSIPISRLKKRWLSEPGFSDGYDALEAEFTFAGARHMPERKRQQDATLMDVLIDGFERNEVLDGFHFRQLPMPDDVSAASKFRALVDEAKSWKGSPTHTDETPMRQLAAWQGFEIRRAGRGIMVRVMAASFDHWWSTPAAWSGDPMGQVFEWLDEEARGSKDRAP